MLFAELRWANHRRLTSGAFHHKEPWKEEHWALAIAGEAGELANVVKKRFRGDKISIKKVLSEIADIVIYCDLMATYLGVDLEDIVRTTFNEKSVKIGSSILIKEDGLPIDD